jgi:hypothetical protein
MLKWQDVCVWRPTACRHHALWCLTFKWPMFAYANACKKKFPTFILCIVGNSEIYGIVKIYCCIISVLFSTKCHLFHNFILFFSSNTFFVNRAQKFKYPPGHLKVKVSAVACRTLRMNQMSWFSSWHPCFILLGPGYKICFLVQSCFNPGKVFCGFPRWFQMSYSTLNQTMTTSFHSLSNSLFTVHPVIQHHLILTVGIVVKWTKN